MIFWFLIMIFNLSFDHQLWIKCVCIDIGNSSGHVEQTHSRFPKYMWMSDTEWKAHQIDILDNLIIIDNLTNTLLTPPPEGKKQYYIANLITKSINITVVFLSWGSFPSINHANKNAISSSNKLALDIFMVLIVKLCCW